jgi:ubiquinone/menaquinone biosynthesis C-methylase UbiE
MASQDVKAQAQARFGQFAHNYVNSDIHATGSDLDRLVEIAAPQDGWLGLDVATGGGHTALRFAQRGVRMIASDIGSHMLEAARAHMREQGVDNVAFSGADAENLPFADNTFDLVTCRVAAHHFPDAYRFVLEAARVLKPGGRLAVHDHLLPEDPAAMDYIEAFETLRDPSHFRAFSESEWRGLLLDAGLLVEHIEKMERAALLIPWAERQNNPPEVVERLRILLAQAPAAVAEWIRPRSVLSPDAGFDHVYILITGTKPS